MKRASATQPPSTTVIGRSRSVRGRDAALAPRGEPQVPEGGAGNESTMVGSAFRRLTIPPAATAPAPM